MRARGMILSELLVASFLLGVSIAGAMTLWTYTTLQSRTAADLASASQLARTELEEAKATGYWYMPLGDYNAANNEAIWLGSFDPEAHHGNGAWSKNRVAYFDVDGNPTKGIDANTRYAVTVQITDDNVAAPDQNTDTYDLSLCSARSICASVKRIPDGKLLLAATTALARGGL